MSPEVARLLERLEGVRRQGSGWVARCPSHHDQHPSLHVNEGDDGRALVFCFGGCGLDDVLGAIGWRRRDLFPNQASRRVR